MALLKDGFLVKDRRLGLEHYVFTRTDPRTDGYKGDVAEGATLEYDMNAVHEWPYGQPRPNPRLGRDPADPNHYRVFKFPEDLEAAGFVPVSSSTPLVEHSWSDYRQRYYPAPEHYATRMTPEEWFDFLEEADAAAKVRKKTNGLARPGPGSDRDQIAEWVAKRHMGSDGGVSQVWYLRSGSPADEIRLLEVSERFTGESAKVEPVDFGLDLDDARYKLLVADVSAGQLEAIKADPTDRLPPGWRIGDAVVWGRRG